MVRWLGGTMSCAACGTAIEGVYHYTTPGGSVYLCDECVDVITELRQAAIA